MIREIFFWGPFLDDSVATVKAIYESAISINKYSKSNRSYIINAVGEWDKFVQQNKNVSVNFVDLNKNEKKFFEKLPRYSFLKSRFSYFKIFIYCFLPLKNLLNYKKPNYLIVHLIVSLPLFLFLIFNFKTKLILRISGKPKLNIFRSLFWRLSAKKIDKVLCPTIATKNLLISKKIFSSEQVFFVPDPIINVKNINKLKKNKDLDIKFEKNNILLVGRLTKQKNFKLFVESFEKIIAKFPNLKAFIIGSGELKSQINLQIKNKKLLNNIFLLGYKKNIFNYMFNSKLFVLTSLWEDPGFTLIESAYCNTIILSSDCESGPKEFLSNEKGGFLFKNNDKFSLENKLIEILKTDNKELKKRKIFAKKQSKKYSMFNHYINLKKYLI